MSIFYHRTTRRSAEAILRDGFRDAVGKCVADRVLRGVWLEDAPLDCNVGANDSHLLKVTLALSDEEMDAYECKRNGCSYREWLVPAAILNDKATVEIVSVDEGIQ